MFARWLKRNFQLYKKLAALLFLLFLLPLHLAAQRAGNITVDRFEETAGRGLIVYSNPEGVRVFIDEIEYGTTPLILENLQHGEFQIRLTREGYKDRSFDITLFSTSRLTVSIIMEEERGFVEISVDRDSGNTEHLLFNPQIIISGYTETCIPVLHENKATVNLPTGFRNIRARAFGWEDISVSVLVTEADTASVNILMKPAAFKIANLTQSRRRFNPLNSNNLGITIYRFEVSAPGSGVLKILNTDKEEVYKTNIENFDTWAQQVSWNGRDSNGNLLPQGIYTVLIEASQNSSEVSVMTLETEIDYSTRIIPLSIESGISGLTFAPMPHVLPQGSYQLTAGVQIGKFLQPQNINYDTTDSYSLPFDINMRVAPFKKLELSTSLNINPYLDNETQTGWSISGSTKYNIINNSLISFAIAASYSWADRAGEPPLSPGRGVGLYTPLSFDLTNFSIVLCPAAFWHGPEGLIPALLLSAGALYHGSWFNTGLSIRCELDFTSELINPKYLTGLEINFFPPPSNFIFSVQTGVMFQEQRTGFYSQIKIGIIN